MPSAIAASGRYPRDMTVQVPVLLLLAVAAATPARGDACTSGPLTLRLQPVATDVQRVRIASTRRSIAVDATDYSAAGLLDLAAAVSLEGAGALPAGTYGVALEPQPDGTLALVLHEPGGLRLRLRLDAAAAAADPSGAPLHCFGGDGTLTIATPLSAGTLRWSAASAAVAPGAGVTAGARPPAVPGEAIVRRPTRGERLREAVKRREEKRAAAPATPPADAPAAP